MKYTFLLIDDDEDDRDLFHEIITENLSGSTCVTLSNGLDIINNLESKRIPIPDIVFLDVNMPLTNGWECLQSLKSHLKYKHIPVIMYSTSAYCEDVKKAQELGALCFFTKPYHYDELKKSICNVAEHLKTNTLEKLREMVCFTQ